MAGACRSGSFGWDILLSGTVWPGPILGKRLADVIRAARDIGHEIGLHAWDHPPWQMRLQWMNAVDETVGRKGPENPAFGLAR